MITKQASSAHSPEYDSWVPGDFKNQEFGAAVPGEELYPKDENGKLIPDSVDLCRTWEALEKCKDAGLTKSIRVSNFNHKQLENTLNKPRLKYKPVCNQGEPEPARFLGGPGSLCHCQKVQANPSSGCPSLPDTTWCCGSGQELQEEADQRERTVVLVTLSIHSLKNIDSQLSLRLFKNFLHHFCTWWRQRHQLPFLPHNFSFLQKSLEDRDSGSCISLEQKMLITGRKSVHGTFKGQKVCSCMCNEPLQLLFSSSSELSETDTIFLANSK
ncbi:PREDICTED: aldose reductase-like [Bison bison bison]|uniref:Aldose reductase-like n=1 Tax=Bison bison bison TaxID=43346 RepID=A0A6P3GU45_BISBB|nr:PREDICTED: aldose reductase-like [Bison bison bison]